MTRDVASGAAMTGAALRICAAVAVFGFASGSLAQPADLVVRGARVVDVVEGESVGPRDVYIRGSRILSIQGSGSTPRNVLREIDAGGLFLLPGLWNFHTHLTLEENEGYAERSLDAFVPNGILTAVDMGGDLERLESWKEQIAAGDRRGPTIYVAGPFIDGAKVLDGSAAMRQRRRNSMVVVDEAGEIPALVGELADQVDLFKVHSRLPRAAFFELAERASEIGVPVAAHLPVGVSLSDAVGAGVATIEHASSFVGDAIYEDDPEALQAAFRRAVERLRGAEGDRLFEAIGDSRICVTPTLLSIVRFAREQGSPFFSQVADDLEWITAQLYLNGARLVAGSDGVEAYGLTQAEALVLELEHLVEAGIPTHEALRAATVNPPACLERDGEGAIEVGAKADLLLLEDDPLADVANVRTIRGLVVRGRYTAVGP